MSSGHSIPSSAANCSRCGHEVAPDDPIVTVNYAPMFLVHHTSCIDAAERRGRRAGYKDALRQMRDATRALKGAKT